MPHDATIISANGNQCRITEDENGIVRIKTVTDHWTIVESNSVLFAIDHMFGKATHQKVYSQTLVWATNADGVEILYNVSVSNTRWTVRWVAYGVDMKHTYKYDQPIRSMGDMLAYAVAWIMEQ